MTPAAVLERLRGIEGKLASRPDAFEWQRAVLGETLSLDSLARVERALPCALPPLLRALYLEVGGEIALRWSLRPACAADFAHDLASRAWGAFIIHPPTIEAVRDEYDELVPRYVAFAGNDNGRVFAIDAETGAVVDYDHEEPERASRVYGTFDAFVEGELGRGFVFTADDASGLERFFAEE
ncbi:hypothetical protein BH09MYX1_BH09MYX1_08340 [soil metagenome]